MNNSPFIFNPEQPIARLPYFSDLPDPTKNYSVVYYIENSSGVWFINRRPYGFYRSSGVEWLYQGEYDQIRQSESQPANSPSILYGRDAETSTYVGALVFINNFGVLTNSSAASLTTSAVAGIVINKPTPTSADLLIAGATPSFYSGLTLGVDYFLDPFIDGSFTTLPPTGPGQIVLKVGVALSSTEFLLNVKNRLVRAL